MAPQGTPGSTHWGFPLVQAAHWLLPPITSFYIIVSIVVRFVLGYRQHQHRKPWRTAVLCSMILLCITYILNSIVLVRLPLLRGENVPQDIMAYTVGSAFIWFLFSLDFSGPGVASYVSLAGCSALYLLAEVFLCLSSQYPRHTTDPFEMAMVGVHGIRLIMLALLVGITVRSFIVSPQRRYGQETTPLLNDNISRGNHPHRRRGEASRYGAMTRAQEAILRDREIEEELTKASFDRIAVKLFTSFYWPRDKPFLQLLCAGVLICLWSERILNCIIPLQLAHVVGALLVNPGELPWRAIVSLAALWLLDSSGGISMLCKCMWSPIESNSYVKIGTTVFDKVLTLSNDFHDSQNPARLWESVSQGLSVRYSVRLFIFHFIPTAFDIAMAGAMLWFFFGIYMAMIYTAVVFAIYWISVKSRPRLLSKQEKLIADMENEHRCVHDATSNWQAAAYVNRIQHEKLKYRVAIANHMDSASSYSRWAHVESLAQSFILAFGFTGLCGLAAYQIARENKHISWFVLLICYWARLSGPIQLFSTLVKDTKLGLLNAWELMAKFNLEPSVFNQPDAKPLVVNQGQVEFKDIKFSYDGHKQVLDEINFRAPAGQTIALVGETGSGKSSILKLLMRLYDPSHGTILIDGQDIRNVTMESLRASVGVVPQEPVLFHDTIMNNIKYANIAASEAQVYEACKALGLHEIFNSFQDGYQTLLGERGVRLSSGELQWVAIARVIIRDPKIIFLDEATNSLDSNTESIVMSKFHKLCMGKTIFMVSHRLSAVTSADKILVFRRGKIVEQGDHESLLLANGYYSCLWSCLARPGLSIETTTDADKPSGTITAKLARKLRLRKAYGEVELPSPADHKAKLPATDRHKVVSRGIPLLKGGIWKPDAPEFVPSSQRYFPEEHGHTQYCSPDDHAGTSEGFTDQNQPRKENLPQISRSLADPISPLKSLIEDNIGDQGAIDTVAGNDRIASVLQQTSNGVVLAHPKRARKRAKKSKNIRRKHTESEPVDYGFDYGLYQVQIPAL